MKRKTYGQMLFDAIWKGEPISWETAPDDEKRWCQRTAVSVARRVRADLKREANKKGKV